MRPVLAAARTGSQTRPLLFALLLLGVLYPWLDQAAGWFRVPGATMALLMVALAIGLTIVVGFAGLLDLGYAAFFAIGSYAAAILTSSGSRLALLLPEFARSPLAGTRSLGGDRRRRIRPCFRLAERTHARRVPGHRHARVWRDRAAGPHPPARLDRRPARHERHPARFVRLGGGALGTYYVALGVATLACMVALRLNASRVGPRLGRRARGRHRRRVAWHQPAAGQASRLCARRRLRWRGRCRVRAALRLRRAGPVRPHAVADGACGRDPRRSLGRGGRDLRRAGHRPVRPPGRGAAEQRPAPVGSPQPAATVDLRQHNYLVFGLALYLATLYRARQAADPPRAPPELEEEPSPA